jgi:hypothetical protein
MMKSEIKMQRLSDGRYIVTVDGASKECQSFGEALDIFRSETGDTASSAKWEELKAENAKLRGAIDSAAHDLEAMTADRDKYKDWWCKLYCENIRLKEAICNAFVKEYAK